MKLCENNDGNKHHARGLCRKCYEVEFGKHYTQRRCNDCNCLVRRAGDKYCQLHKKLRAVEIVPVEPFQEPFVRQRQEDEEFSNKVCRYMYSKGYKQYLRKDKGPYYKADATHLRRQLGLKSKPSHGRQYYTKYLQYEEAVHLARALNLAPVDAGV